ncbi:hypothetical protein [Paraburkholderia caribensis]|uniref:hypothetical protein n=1 Tax=Paraburkholderia caribensis TaxID=75105 RepID=UPI000720FBB2|nr:hypothetical protein [Paraburkholderia caribensis]ALP65227.1 hypothetical protein AN416_21795 [Paraburkholderia caribensis]AUT53618.1 hypothetical protein C2L66_16700 [Paraburkholderia caribensis]
MKPRIVHIAAYLGELATAYALAFCFVYFVDTSKATFQAGLALFFVSCACLIGRPFMPHALFKWLARPAVALMSIVVLGFGTFGTQEPDLTILAPGVGLCLLGAAFADRVERSRTRK